MKQERNKCCEKCKCQEEKSKTAELKRCVNNKIVKMKRRRKHVKDLFSELTAAVKNNKMFIVL